jgi:hypothetical protein
MDDAVKCSSQLRTAARGRLLLAAAALLFGPEVRAAGGLSSPASPSSTHVSPEQASWWAFQPVRQPPLPSVRDSSWSVSPVDRFILAGLEERGLRPAPRASAEVLLRRVYFDLIGLPPSPADVSAFRRDPSSRAFHDIVEQLLASPRYGERWGRHWMDVVRYADTAGDNADYPVPEARLYRDFIIDSFNADKPYDQFVRQQLAGDILAKDGPPERFGEQVVGTGFLALSRRYATAPFEFMHLTIEDAIDTTGRTFLGMTMRCARCHDHKYDPVSKEDYYALYGFFASTRFPYAGSEEFQSKNFPRTGFVPLTPGSPPQHAVEQQRERAERLRAELPQLEKDVEAAKTNPVARATLEKQLKQKRDELKRAKLGSPPDLAVAYAVSEGKPVDETVHLRGEPAERGPAVLRRAPCSLGLPGELHIPTGASGRRELADWIASPANPLTARVMVNRIWQYHFGAGLVGTASNFGLRGDRPSHPELLDFMAGYFIAHGWSVKAMHRLILNSASWEQAATPASEAIATAAAQIDPGNHLHWRHERRRLEAEAIRDAMLYLANTLEVDRPGPHPFPKVEDWNWTQHNPFKAVYVSNHRSVYLMTQRLQRHPYLALFDAPDANVSTDVRPDSTVPLQALYLMNHPFVQTQSTAFAHRVRAGATTEEARIRSAIEWAWSRPPTEAEIARGLEYLRGYQHEAEAAGSAVARAEEEAWASYARVLLTANEFFYVD